MSSQTKEANERAFNWIAEYRTRIDAYSAQTGSPPGRRILQRWGASGRLAARVAAILKESSVDLPIQEDKLPAYALDGEEVPIEELIAHRVKTFERLSARKEAERIQDVSLDAPGPYGLVVFGDPHIDDPGCNWPLLRHVVTEMQENPHFYGVNVGDTTNNWTGRLAKIWAEQDGTQNDSIRLAKWLINSVKWAGFLLGNHDMWQQGRELYRFMLDGADVRSFGVFELRMIVDSEVRIAVRHDFPGRSQWNPVHGAMKAGTFELWGDIYLCGHTHEWMTARTEGRDGTSRLFGKVAGFKKYDSYSEKLGFYQCTTGEFVVIIVDLDANSPIDRFKEFWDIEEASEYLRYIRERRGYER